MRTHDDSPRVPARPSLLTQAQQAEAERSRILSTLEGGPAGASGGARPGTRQLLRWSMGAAAVLLLLAAGAWLGQRGGPARHDGEQAAPASLSGMSAQAAADDAPRAVASIHDEAPPAAVAPQPLQATPESLSDMLDAPPATAAAAATSASAAHPGDVLSKALESPSPAVSAPKQVARAARPAAKKPAAKAPAPAPVRRADDSDIVLLSALLAHAQAAPAPKKTAALRARLQQCMALKNEAAAACRARACQGQGEQAQCTAAQAGAKGGK